MALALIVPHQSPRNASAGLDPDGATIDRLLVAIQLLIPIGASPTEIRVDKMCGATGALAAGTKINV